MTPILTSITRYPVKSCRGQLVTEALVEPWGLAGDRRWMLVDETGLTLTGRQSPQLVLVVPTFTDDGLLLTAPDLDPLHVPVPVSAGEASIVGVNVWGDPFDAVLASDEGTAWFRKVTGRNVRLVYLEDPTQRPAPKDLGQSGDVVSFADGFPLLLAAEESLAALNGWIAEGRRADEGPMPMTRFRTNLTVSGSPAWMEDRWRRVRIGDATFRSVKACERCAFTLVNPEDATKTKEPLFSLAKHRRWGGSTWFGVNLIPDNPGAVLRVGDELEVLEQVDNPDPQR